MSDLNKAKAGNGGGLYILPGDYTLQIEGIKRFQSAQGGVVVAVDFLILASTNPERKPNSRVGTVFQESTSIGMSNMKEFFVAATGLSPHNVADQDAVNNEDWNKVRDLACSPDQTLSGLKIYATGVERTKRKTVGDPKKDNYTRVTYAPHEETRKKFHEAAE